jgi:hypothetical protein
MDYIRSLDLHGILDHGNPDAVLRYVGKSFSDAYPGVSFSGVKQAFNLTHDLYFGRFPGYVACRTGYHDYRHTMDVFVASMRLLDGGILDGRGISPALAEDVLIASLLHDSGYIQEIGDEEGTGARYTKTHVARSVDFVKSHSFAFGINRPRAERIGRLITGTELSMIWKDIPFDGDDERTAAAVLAARIFWAKWPTGRIWKSCSSSTTNSGGRHRRLQDRLRHPAQDLFLLRLHRGAAERPPRRGVLRREDPFRERCGEDRDLYREAIHRQMTYLSDMMVDNTVNFRKRLRRLDLEQVERAETARLTSLGVVFV